MTFSSGKLIFLGLQMSAYSQSSVYPHYDIVVWSQTGWRWLESKLVELGVIGGDKSYKISFVSDRTTMFPVSLKLFFLAEFELTMTKVFTQRNGQVFKHE